MEKEKVQTWLDELIEIRRRQHAAQYLEDSDLDSPCCFVNPINEIHLSKVTPLAKALGIPAYIRGRNDSQFPYEAYFRYKGIRFFAIGKEKADI